MRRSLVASVCSAPLAQPTADALAAVLQLLPRSAAALVAHEKVDGKKKGKADTRKQFTAAMTKAGLAFEAIELPAADPEALSHEKDDERALRTNVRLWNVHVVARAPG